MNCREIVFSVIKRVTESETIAKSATNIRSLLLKQVCHSNYQMASNADGMPGEFLNNYFALRLLAA